MRYRRTNGERGGSSRVILDEAAQTLRARYGAGLDDLVVERLVVGVFFVGVKLSNGCGGVAYTPPDVIRTAGNRILRGSTPFIRGMKAAEVMAGNVPGPFAGIIRLATLNALSVPFLEDGHYRVDESGDLSGVPMLFRDRRICMVGAMVPLLKRLKHVGTAGVYIIDRKQETRAEAEEGYGTFIQPERTAETLASCETAIFTGAAIANNSIRELISQVPAGAAITVAGPTAGFVPEPLFRRGVALVGTVVVSDSDLALDILAEGGGGYRLFKECVRKINLINGDQLRHLGLECREERHPGVPTASS